MNRPNKEDYGTWEKCPEGWERRLHSIDYQLDLEKYCDELEKVNERLTEALANISNSFCDDIKSLEKALDKACELLPSLDCYDCRKVHHIVCEEVATGEFGCTCSDWKRWLLKDDE